MAVFSLRPHVVAPCVLTSSSYKDTSRIGLGPPSWPCFNVIISLKVLRCCGRGFQHMHFRGTPCNSQRFDLRQLASRTGRERVSAVRCHPVGGICFGGYRKHIRFPRVCFGSSFCHSRIHPAGSPSTQILHPTTSGLQGPEPPLRGLPIPLSCHPAPVSSEHQDQVFLCPNP